MKRPSASSAAETHRGADLLEKCRHRVSVVEQRLVAGLGARAETLVRRWLSKIALDLHDEWAMLAKHRRRARVARSRPGVVPIHRGLGAGMPYVRSSAKYRTSPKSQKGKLGHSTFACIRLAATL
jgi:hypothetical protein